MTLKAEFTRIQCLHKKDNTGEIFMEAKEGHTHTFPAFYQVLSRSQDNRLFIIFVEITGYLKNTSPVFLVMPG